jgi:DNA helicase II / ATP-dependent DNA helicase PcrA
LSLLDALNPEQRSAAEAVDGPVLIFAGAGSGKTRALTYRIAHMVQECGIDPGAILAVTFTNKAAGEMKERITKLIGRSGRGLWAGTFHSVCARLLRADGPEIGLPANFTIYDEGDQIALIKQALHVLDIDPKTYKPADIHYAISDAKNELLGPQEYRRGGKGPFDDIVRRVYAMYQQTLRDNGALDFDDLIMRAVQLLREKPEVLARYQDRFQYVLVDEYQDINFAQYQLVSRLAARHHNICVVGDDDQSIYGWRGANVGIILDFEKDFPKARVVKLEQNYRSTRTILECAYAVIKHNKTRADKKLWTQNREGDNVVQYQAVSAEEEADWVAESIRTQVESGLGRYGDYAILYRTNAMSRVFEEALMTRKLPYVIVGGIRFYERAIIKDFIAYLRIIHNPADAVSLARIINTPARGIGDKTVAAVAQMGHSNQCSLFEAVRYAAANEDLPRRARESLAEFRDLLDGLRDLARTASITDLCREVVERSGYLRALEQSGTSENAAKAENLKEFVSLAQRYQQTAEAPTLESFLEHLALISSLDEAENLGSQVSLMTLHSAKGLEFTVVFMVGMEEGIFPHQRSIGNDAELEEERRLCYVGVTRAQQMLYLSHCHRRTIYGTPQAMAPSRFLRDLPEERVTKQVELSGLGKLPLDGDGDDLPEVVVGGRKLDIVAILDRARRNGEAASERAAEQTPEAPKPAATRRKAAAPAEPRKKAPAGRKPAAPPGASVGDYQPGDHVTHAAFGQGVVVQVSGEGTGQQLTVAFPKQGVKQLMVAYAPIEKA